ncbi:MAG: hypothetical protein HY893_03355 [Deltaproteobacteria bacterium]|nr:hypothetical protein [Deltaproteobacteria bacterium]
MASERLWIDHIILVRSFVSYRLEGNTEAVKMIDKKVVRNMNEIGYLIAPFYGKGTYEQFSTLLSRHYTAVKEYLDTSLTSDRFARERAIDRLNANMEEIADFLSSENSDISMETISSLLRAHAGYNVAQIDAVKAKNFTAEQEVWEAMERNVYRIADALADGMIKQFPDKF